MTGNKDIKTYLVKNFVIAVGLSFLFAFLITFIIVSRDFNNIKKQSISTIVNDEAGTITARIDEMFASAKTIAADEVIANPNVPLDKKITKMSQYGHQLGIGSLGYITKEGYLTSTDGFENDISERQYFKDLMQDIPYISYPQFNTATGKQIIFIGVPRYYNGEIVGAMTCCFDSSVLSDLVTQLNYMGEGRSYMISDTGLTIASYDLDAVLNNYNILELAETDSSLKESAKIHEIMLSNESGYLEFDNKYLFYDNVRNGANWTLVFELPKSVFSREIYSILKVFVFCMIVTISIVVVVSLNLGKKLENKTSSQQ